MPEGWYMVLRSINLSVFLNIVCKIAAKDFSMQ